MNDLRQLFPPKPEFVEKDLPDLNGKVYIVSGSNTGVGKELAQMLYSKNATVYIAARLEDKALKAIDSIKALSPSSTGVLHFLKLDLGDLATINSTVSEFTSKESQLHVLFNNAGVMNPPQGSKTAQGYELQLGTNNIGTLMFTQLLAPTLANTAKASPAGTVRVIWVSSSAAEKLSPKNVIPMDNLDYHNDKGGMYKYGVSKAGNYLHATEFAKRHEADGVLSLALNPGNLDSDLYRNVPKLLLWFLRKTVLYPSKYGAYTELFAGLSPKVIEANDEHWVVPWGRFTHIRKDLLLASKSKEDGGSGVGKAFWDWNEEQYKKFL